MNSNPRCQPLCSGPQLTDRSPSAQDGSPLVVETERLHELRRQVAAQEQKLQSLRQQAANNHVPSSADQDVMKSVIFTKERELALALMKVAELTSQLEHLRRTRADDGRQSQPMLETNLQSKGVIQRIIPIKLLREDVRQSRDARKVSGQDANTDSNTDGSKRGVRVIPIVLEKTVSKSGSPVPNAVQQEQGISTEKVSLSHRHPMQTEVSSPTAEKGSNSIETAAETRKARRCTDVNENVDDGELAMADLSTTGFKDGFSVKCSAGSDDGRPNRSSEKVAVEKVYIEKVGTANYCYEKANSEKVNVAVFDSRRSMESKFDDTFDVAKKTSNVIDKTVVSNMPCGVGGDGKSKLEDATQRSIGDEIDGEMLVIKNKKDAVNESHSAGDSTGNTSSTKENCVDVSSYSKNDGASSSNIKNENCKTKIITSQDRRSFFNFPPSNQLVGSCKDSSGASSSIDANARNRVSNGVQCPLANSSGRISEPGLKADRARFFMDMMRENVSDTGVVQSWMEKPRVPISSEFRNTISPIVSPMASSISRGRSSSSAIMSRFAPQPYGRSKSVDSGSLRAHLTALGSAVRREQSPDATVGVAETVSPRSTTSYKMPTQHLVTPSSDRHYCMSEAPSVSSESHIQTEMSVLSSRKIPYPLLFQKSGSSDGAPCRSSDVSLQKSFPEEKADVRSVPSPPVDLMSDSKPRKIDRESSAGGTLLLGDKVRYSMPSASGSVTVFSALQNLSSSAKDSPSRHEYTYATTSNATKTPNATDGISTLSARVTSPVNTVPCGIMKSLHGRPSPASIDVQTGLASQNAKSPCTHLSLLNTTLLPNLKTLQQNLRSRSLPECRHQPFVGEPGNCTSGSSSSLTVAKPDSNSSRSVDYQSEEAIGNTACDSNAKRLAREYSVTIGDAVPSRTDCRGDRKLDSSRGITGGDAEVSSLSNGSNYSSCANVLEHSRAEKQSAVEPYSGTLLPASSKLPSRDLSTSFGFNGTPISAIQRRQTPQFSSVAMTSSSSSSPSSEAVDSSVDTSVDSVSSALSVLLKSSSSAAGQSSPVRPSRLRTTVSSAYRRKLGSGAMDNYSQNMTLLYGDCSAKKDDGSVGSNVQEPVEEETMRSSPVRDTPLTEDLPHILALNALDGTPFYSRTGSHSSRDIHGCGVDVVNGKAANQHGDETELLKSGDVELTVISSPRQTADLVRLDATEGDIRPSGSFNPPEDIVSSFIDDPSSFDDSRCPPETLIQPRDRLFTRRNGRSQRHVTFDQVSLLLSAALEGEKDLVIDIINKLSNPNQKTETGLTAIHNAVCGNHYDVLKYLVEFGCDVNVADNDGWTPLHCAASTNNIEMLTMLVQNGAGVLPMTISDREIPLQKCARNLPAYEEAVKYLTDTAGALGVANDGWVYVTSNFANVCSDELVLHAGERLKILRKGDENESEWWWAKNGDVEGYAPQSLLALYPSIQPKWVK